MLGTAANGSEAIAEAEQMRPDIVLMDAQMPVMDDEEATRRIKALMPEIKILFLTVHAGYVDRAIAAGADLFLVKGSGRRELVQCIRELGCGCPEN